MAEPATVGVNHAGLAVPDLDAAVDWYTSVLGLRLLRGPEEVDAATPSNPVHRDVFGTGFTGCRLAFLALSDGSGLELFEFPAGVSAPTPWGVPVSAGLFHLALTCPDVEATAAAVAATGGRLLSAVHRTPRCTICYCTDPFGTVLELVDRKYSVAHGPR